jgi:hypothetical protein
VLCAAAITNLALKEILMNWVLPSSLSSMPWASHSKESQLRLDALVMALKDRIKTAGY